MAELAGGSGLAITAQSPHPRHSDTGTSDRRTEATSEQEQSQASSTVKVYISSSKSATPYHSSHAEPNPLQTPTNAAEESGTQITQTQAVVVSSINNGYKFNGGGGSRADPVPKNGRDKPGACRSFLLPLHPVLPKLGEVPEDAENHSESSIASSTSAFLLPLPPVPTDMAEAIKRQQKGAGGVRYWKTKHLQSGRNQSMSLKNSHGGFQNATFPILKHSAFSGSENGMGVNGSATSGVESRLKKAKERLIRQKNRENAMLDFRRNVTGTSINGQVPVYHTQYMYGHALGGYPPPPPAHKRSVTALETLISLPFPGPFMQTTAHKLTSDSNPNPNLTLTDESRSIGDLTLSDKSCAKPELSLTDESKSKGDPTLTEESRTKPELTPKSASQQHNGSSGDTEKGPESGEMVKHRYPREEGSREGLEEADMAELTCLQLADAILGSKRSDISQYYQICQTKIRYVDFLERSATFRNADTTKTTPSDPPGAHYTVNGPSRLNTWVPSLDLKDSRLDDAVLDRKSWDNGREGRSPVSFPSLVSPSPNGADKGLKMTHGLPPSPGRGFLPSPLHDLDGTSPAHVVPSGVSSKPILKPFNPDAIPVKVRRHYDPYSPRSVFSDIPGATPYEGGLNVRGTTMYPLKMEEGRMGQSKEASRRSQSSNSRKEAELRKRAVRFSISDQVYEFAPGEPLAP